MLEKATSKRNILLVDDDQSITQMLSMLLETRGYGVDVANSGQEAYDRISMSTDLVILDLVLPDVEGFDVCRRLKENSDTSHIPIIILSSRLLSRDIVEGLYLGADDYLTKPFEYEELVARIEAVIRRASIFRTGSLSPQGDESVLRELKTIIRQELITPFFQPIYRVEPFGLLGFESLTRAKSTGMLTNPEFLFKAAIHFGYYQDLEMTAWRKSLDYAAEYLDTYKLFLNCNPYLIQAAKFFDIIALFKNHNINLENIVLEITERSAVTDFDTFFQYLRDYRWKGFNFAVDDVGGGYASLDSIVQIKPEVVKIDHHIVRDIEKDNYKRSIVKFIVSFCRENSILSIAEGVETKEEYDVVKEVGIDAVQGYYLYRPSPVINLDDILAVAS